MKFLPIFKSISCLFSNIFSQSHRIPCFSGISIGIEFYWQSMEGQLDPRYWLSFLHPELLPVYPGRALYSVYIFPPFLDCRHQPTDCSISTSSWIGATVAANVPTINRNSIKLSTRPVSLHMCFGEEAAATRTGQINISSDKTFFFVCEAENLSKIGTQAAGMVPLWNYSLCPPTITVVFAKPTSAGLLLLKWSLVACGVQIPCQRCGQFGQSQMKVGPDLKCFDALWNGWSPVSSRHL